MWSKHSQTFTTMLKLVLLGGAAIYIFVTYINTAELFLNLFHAWLRMSYIIEFTATVTFVFEYSKIVARDGT